MYLGLGFNLYELLLKDDVIIYFIKVGVEDEIYDDFIFLEGFIFRNLFFIIGIN